MRNMALKDLCIMKSGGTPSRKNPSFYEGEIPWAKISDLEFSPDGYIHDTKEHITQEALASINNRFFDAGTLFLAMYGSVGKTGISKIPMTTNQAILGINIKEKDLLDIDYLKYWFKTIKQRLLNRAVGAALPNISLTIVKELKIPLPPLDQQKKIAAILDAADAYRQKTKALIEKYDELTQSLFLDMFGDPVRNPKGWEEIKLGNICGVGSSKRVFVDELVEDGIPFYRGTEVGKLGEGKSIIPKLFITKEHYERLKEHRGIPKKGDLLMPSICPDGRIWVVDDDKEFYFKDGRVLWVEVDSRKINSIYLRYHMKGSFFANYNNIASGTTFAELKIVALKKMNIFYPDIALQNQFAERVQAIEVQKAQAQASLAQAEDLFNSLLQRAFKGELTN